MRTFFFFFFFFFLLFTFENDENLFWVYQIGNFLPGKSISRREKNQEKWLCPLRKICLLRPCQRSNYRSKRFTFLGSAPTQKFWLWVWGLVFCPLGVVLFFFFFFSESNFSVQSFQGYIRSLSWDHFPENSILTIDHFMMLFGWSSQSIDKSVINLIGEDLIIKLWEDHNHIAGQIIFCGL